MAKPAFDMAFVSLPQPAKSSAKKAVLMARLSDEVTAAGDSPRGERATGEAGDEGAEAPETETTDGERERLRSDRSEAPEEGAFKGAAGPNSAAPRAAFQADG